MRNYAVALGITGFSENLPDGSVKLLAEGEETLLVSFLKLVQYGSLLSKVVGLDYKWEKFTGKYNDFSGKNLLFPEDIILPKHVAIIPDGNRRWAKDRGLHTLEGHKAGFDRFPELTKAARDAGIKTMTIWGFSTENWDRKKSEVDYLFNIFNRAIDKFAKEIKENEIRFRHLGRKTHLPEKIVNRLSKLENDSSKNNKYFLNFALDYGGRDEIVRGVKKIIDEKIKSSDGDDKLISDHLDTSGLTDPDLIIRTSGEQRTSGLLPWQSTYAEFYFAPVHFPDFDASQFKLALLEYSQRQRRFGV